MKRNVYLVGFMGSGKSTVGPLLSERLGCAFYDLDALIEKDQGRSIAEIFKSEKEPFFRKVESECLAQALGLAPCVLALGGGTFAAEENRSVISANGVSIWLELSAELAWSRCGRSLRPLARDRGQFETLFRDRRRFYQLADIRIQTEGKTPGQVCSEALERLVDHPL